MFRNFRRYASSSSASFNARLNPAGHKMLNNSVRTFSGTASSSTFSPLVKTLVTGGLLIGTGYLLNKTMNEPTQAIGRYGNTSELAQQRLVQPDMARTGLNPIVQQYMSGTYKYVALNVALTTLFAVGAYKSGLVFRILNMNPWMHLLVFGGGMIGTNMITRSLDINTNSALKHTMLTAFNGIVGLSLCYVGLMYRPEIIMRAALYTAGIFGALSYVAINAEQDKFLSMGGPLLAGLAVVFLSSLAPLVLPATMTRTLQATEAIALYGGLLLFGMFILYETQKVRMKGENYKNYVESETMRGTPNHMIQKPDYINSSISLYMDMVNIFVRLLYILGGNNRK
ncbi:hypothetical protein NAEGRDRAFT_80200 [Naegleria gruberi]|uniref:Uncharacterized protein n=1 Tax=Naegleria gruberi TaxID=5762 RepID=D2VJJ1_NAEGR|nr:uncharacterized protein NAEGRDRAFT_80200 [Naegleria gruberi]EFC42954.1 hypothetical protein NAEGRDRAFT_80200 [Naegleria gruberi]|eukprot:XP_002675698.1 hypothetical protein NAEGRDRAFT_80200 [Naegleria gruberi strain NEG-M]